MNYFIAIDSGGTKTDTVLFDETGHIILRDISSGCNAADIGEEAAKLHCLEVIQRVSARAPQPIRAIYGGIAGTYFYGNMLYDYVRPQIDAVSLRLEDDVNVIISGTLGTAPGCCMICGTGSSMTVRTNERKQAHIGGYGYLIDTGGSGFELGQDALRMALRAYDGRGERTILTDLFQREFHSDTLHRCLPQVYGGGRAYIASFSRFVFEGCQQGDHICQEIFERGSNSLAELTWTAATYFSGDFDVILAGGIFFSYPEYVKAVKSKSSPAAQMMLSEVPPVYGGAVEAMADAGLTCSDNFRRQFLSDYTS